MTKEDWKGVEDSLRGAYGRAELIVDGFEITLQVERIKTLRYGIIVYVNGSWKGESLMKDCEERRRFFRRVNVVGMKPKQYAAWRRAFGKKDADAQREKSRGGYWLPHWASFGPLRRHFVAHNSAIAIKVQA